MTKSDALSRQATYLRMAEESGSSILAQNYRASAAQWAAKAEKLS